VPYVPFAAAVAGSTIIPHTGSFTAVILDVTSNPPIASPNDYRGPGNVVRYEVRPIGAGRNL
jgi:hypothetical protein